MTSYWRHTVQIVLTRDFCWYKILELRWRKLMLHYRYHNLVMKIFRNYPSHTTPHISDASVIKKMLFILSEFHDLCQIIYVAKDDMALIPWPGNGMGLASLMNSRYQLFLELMWGNTHYNTMNKNIFRLLILFVYVIGNSLLCTQKLKLLHISRWCDTLSQRSIIFLVFSSYQTSIVFCSRI